MDPPPSSRSWSIHGRIEITERYEILEPIGAGAYSDVYRGCRRSDGLAVALKEIRDYRSAFREIEALQTLRGSPNVIELVEYFWAEEETVLVLEFLLVDLASVIRRAKRDGGIHAGELKQWMLQILRGVDACHRNAVVHRDLKPSNLLVSAEGVLKLADFGQARILQESRIICRDNAPYEQVSESETQSRQQTPIVQEVNPSWPDGHESGALTDCVGTRWFKAPELLYGSKDYGLEIDLWSLGCIFAELLSLEPLFPGTSDIDQLGKIFDVMGDLNEESCPGFSKLPYRSVISFKSVEDPIGLEARLPNRSPTEVNLARRLVCYNPARRACAAELLHDKYFDEEPLPVPANELRIPATGDGHYESSRGEWRDDGDSDSDLEEFGGMDVVTTDKGFSIRFS